jgi:hypothetical protein
MRMGGLSAYRPHSTIKVDISAIDCTVVIGTFVVIDHAHFMILERALSNNFEHIRPLEWVCSRPSNRQPPLLKTPDPAE